MTDEDPELSFSDLTKDVVIDGHHFEVEAYKTSIDPGWILSIMNEFGTLTIFDNTPYIADGLAWRAFEELIKEEGIKARFNDKERRKLRL